MQFVVVVFLLFCHPMSLGAGASMAPTSRCIQTTATAPRFRGFQGDIDPKVHTLKRHEAFQRKPLHFEPSAARADRRDLATRRLAHSGVNQRRPSFERSGNVDDEIEPGRAITLLSVDDASREIGALKHKLKSKPAPALGPPPSPSSPRAVSIAQWQASNFDSNNRKPAAAVQQINDDNGQLELHSDLVAFQSKLWRRRVDSDKFQAEFIAPIGAPKAKPREDSRDEIRAPRNQTAAEWYKQIEQQELIELLGELYAKVQKQRLEMNPTTPGESSSGLLLNKWLRESQANFETLKDTKFEILTERPNRTIIVCNDGPKILVLPNVSDILYCYTKEQWPVKLWDDLRLSSYNYPIILINCLIFILGAVGNIFVCGSVYRNQQLRSVTNYFIVNLAFADLLVILICLPTTVVWDTTLTWFFGTLPCKLIMFLQDVSISVSVLTLTAISIDRYYAICHPLRFKSSLNQAKRVIALIWLISLLIMSPDLVYLTAKRSQELHEAGIDTVLYSDCNYDWHENNSRWFQFVKTVLLYLVPFILMFCAHYKIMRALKAASAVFKERANQMHIPPTNSAEFDYPATTHLQMTTATTSPDIATACDATGLCNDHPPFVCPQRKPILLTTTLSTDAVVAGSVTTASSNSNPANIKHHRKRLVKSSAAPPADGSQLASSAPSDIHPLISNDKSSSSSSRQMANANNIKSPQESLDRSTNSSLHSRLMIDSPADQQRPQFHVEVQDDILARFSADSSDRDIQRCGKLIASPSSAITSNSLNHQVLMTMHNRSRFESRRTAARMLSIIVILFGVCYFPVHLINFLRHMIEDIPQTEFTSTMAMLAHCICYLNSAINPIIYNHMNSVFRAEFRKYLSFCLVWRSKPKCKSTSAKPKTTTTTLKSATATTPVSVNSNSTINQVNINIGTNIDGHNNSSVGANRKAKYRCKQSNSKKFAAKTSDLGLGVTLLTNSRCATAASLANVSTTTTTTTTKPI